MSANNKSTVNPLGLEPKREKSGSDTFRKYNFQYHWAFCRMLDELENGKEFALFIEEHEDVTVADSLDAEKTTFEFNQVKETSKKHTIQSLTKKTKKDPLSLIEKLAKSCCDKSYSKKISRVNFVSTGGYSFELHKDGFNFEVISSSQLSENEGKVVAGCIAEIKDTGGFYEKLAFVIPELPDKGFDLLVEGRISSLISKIAPGFKYDSSSIYSCVIRDLNRKGENSFDYTDWDHAIRKKAITHKQLSTIIEQYIGRKPDENIVAELTQILKDDYAFNSITRRSVVGGFNRYYAKRMASREKLVNDVSMDIISNIEKLAHKYSSAKDLEAEVVNSLSKSTLSFFQTSEDITGAFLYEFLEGVEI
jgi:Txe/YoeB family toxin of Txe-Axe toxin-antitoxin module